MTRALITRDPRESVAPLWNFTRAFDDIFGRGLLRNDDGGDRLIAPALDITEDEHQFVVSAELPGLKKEDVQIQFENGVLAISGEKKQEAETSGPAGKGEKNWHRMERRYGAFYRSITLPAGVDVEKVEATFSDGVLSIRVPKREELKPKTIKIT
jgi:HSP20 family protein